jgi:2-polyprenyl-3-methyl-5-hydroxy-6-metoxy-1,4-benzoquinol methylase
LQQAATDTTVLSHPDGRVLVTPLADGRWRLAIETDTPFAWPRPLVWETGYPPALVETLLNVKGPRWVIDEIRRDEDPLYVENDFRHDIFSFVAPEDMREKTVLDFGCGSGASGAVLSRLAPGCRITGVEMLPAYRDAAEERAAHLGLDMRCLLSPSADSLPDELGSFDFILFSAVMEHLLPDERRALLPLVWTHLSPGGVLFLNQTPHRWFPIEGHTTGLPLINFLPDDLTAHAARRFSRYDHRGDTWPDLLRAGIRGSTEGEILSILRRRGERVTSLKPSRNGIANHLDLWRDSAAARHAHTSLTLKYMALKAVRALTGDTVVPNITLALRKEPNE